MGAFLINLHLAYRCEGLSFWGKHEKLFMKNENLNSPSGSSIASGTPAFLYRAANGNRTLRLIELYLIAWPVGLVDCPSLRRAAVHFDGLVLGGNQYIFLNGGASAI